MINAGAITAVSLVPGATPDERFARIRDFYSACAGRPARPRPRGICLGKGDRQPQPRDRLHAAELRGARRRPRRRPRRLLPAMLDQGHQHRSGPDGGHTGPRRREPDDRATSDRHVGGAAHAQRDGDMRDVRCRRRLGERGRDARQEWRGWRNCRRVAGSARNRRLFPAIGCQGQQRSRSQGVPQPIAAIRAAFPHCHKGIPFDHPVHL